MTRRYRRALLVTALSLLAGGALARWSPLALLVPALALVAYGEDVVLWAYTRFKPVEPARVAVGEVFPAAYDPLRRLHHWLWRVEPNRSLMSASAVLQTVHELYNKLAMRGGEYLSILWLDGRKYARFSAPSFDLARVAEVERVLSEYFVLRREPPWVGSGRPVSKAVYLTSIWALIYAALVGPAALALLPIWLWHVKRFAEHYREPYSAHAFSHMLAEDLVSVDRQTLELVAPADAKAFASMRSWAVVFTPGPPHELLSRYAKTYEGRDTGKRLVRLHQLGPLVERIAQYNERPIQLFAFGVREAHGLYLARDWLAAAEFWRLRGGARALSGDLARFPLFYFGKLMSAGREVALAYDAYTDQPVYISLDALPNVHGVIIGPSGMGKSWTVATWADRLADEVDVIFIDPHADYLAWGELHGAQIIDVPRQLPRDLPEVVRRSSWFKRLLPEFGYDEGATIEDLLGEEGVEPKWVELRRGHAVFLLSGLRRDSLRQALWGSIILIYLVEKLLEERREELSTIIVFDEARLFTNLHAKITTPYAMAADLAQGGRKFGFALWFVLQLETQISEDLLRTASLQLFLGGGEDYVKPLAARAYLDREDVEFLSKPVTPRVARKSGAPYTIGVLRVKPGNLKYHVKIPLDVRMKPGAGPP